MAEKWEELKIGGGVRIELGSGAVLRVSGLNPGHSFLLSLLVWSPGWLHGSSGRYQ